MYLDPFFDGMAVVLMAELLAGTIGAFLFRKK